MYHFHFHHFTARNTHIIHKFFDFLTCRTAAVLCGFYACVTGIYSKLWKKKWICQIHILTKHIEQLCTPWVPQLRGVISLMMSILWPRWHESKHRATSSLTITITNDLIKHWNIVRWYFIWCNDCVKMDNINWLGGAWSECHTILLYIREYKKKIILYVLYESVCTLRMNLI